MAQRTFTRLDYTWRNTIGYYVPEPGRGQKTVKSNDVYRADNGLLYLIDRLDGLEILESEV